MPQYRKLYTKVTYSLDFNDMPDDFTRLFWVLLPCGLSSEGTCIAHPGYIRSKVFPLRQDVSDESIHGALAWFEEHGMVRFYEVAGRKYLWVVNFSRYQGRTDKEAKSDFPPVPKEIANEYTAAPDQLQTYSVPTPDLLRRKSTSDADVDSNVDVDSDRAPSALEAPQPPPQPSNDLAPVYSAYQNVFGMISSQAVADDLADLVKDMAGVGGRSGPECVLAAIEEAKNSSKGLPSLKYLKSILARWKREGGPSSRGSPGNGDGRMSKEEISRHLKAFGIKG